MFASEKPPPARSPRQPPSQRQRLFLALLLTYTTALMGGGYFLFTQHVMEPRMGSMLSDWGLAPGEPLAGSTDDWLAAQQEAAVFQQAGASKQDMAGELDAAEARAMARAGGKQGSDSARNGTLSVLAKKHPLTKELLRSVAENNTVLVTFSNYGYRDFALNWVEHVQATGCKAFLVGAMDDALLKLLLSHNIPAFAMSSGLTQEEFGWGTPAFLQSGRERANLVYQVTRLGFKVLLSDVDAVWMRNPMPYMNQYPEADILTSSDSLHNTVEDEGLEMPWDATRYTFNVGIVLLQPSAAEFAREWLRQMEKSSSNWDQAVFHQLLSLGKKLPRQGSRDRMFRAYNGKLKAGVLPVSLFCGGHVYYVQRISQRLGLQPYVAHATYQFSATSGKRHRMRERLLWNDPPEYFDHPRGFITYTPDIPQALLDAAGRIQRNGTTKASRPHFDLVKHQLMQMRAQFAVADLLGRSAILPQVWCGQDLYFRKHNGTAPNAGPMELPFQCPADHILDLRAMTNSTGGMDFREYSFLDNPRAEKLKSQVLTIRICESPPYRGCNNGSAPAVARKGVVRLRPHLNSSQMQLALRDVAKQYKVLDFRGMERAWGRFDDPERQAEFRRRVYKYGRHWCCHWTGPQLVKYHFFWDLPHLTSAQRNP